jgi:phosphatidylglycerophosphatase A
MSEPTDAPQEAAARQPRFALFIATACGLGYIPKAPGTFGSLAGCAVAILSVFPWLPILNRGFFAGHSENMAAYWLGRLLFFRELSPFWSSAWPCFIPLFLIAALGLWSASRVESETGVKDPQHVVIDEVSGQHLTFVLGLAAWSPYFWTGRSADFVGYGFLFAKELLDWKYLLLGFILFRVFDIWKPFPARQAESLPGGWGIMADDWVAGIYAGIGLWIARAVGL